MRRVVLKHCLVEGTNVVRTGPNPAVLHVGEADWCASVWVEVDAVSADLSDPSFESHELVFDVVRTGVVDGGVVLRPYHRHVGSVITAREIPTALATVRRTVELHVYLVTASAFDVEEMERRWHEALWVLNRTEPGDRIRHEVRRRDGNRCRFCGGQVSWNAIRTTVPSPHRAVYALVDVWDPVTVDNVVLACESCTRAKGVRTPAEAGMRLLEPPAPAARAWSAS